MEKLNNFRNVLLLFTTVVTVASTVVGGVIWIDSRYAHAEELQTLEERVELNELKDQLRNALDELHFWRQQARKYPDDEEVQDEVDTAKELVDEIKEKIKSKD